MEATLGQSDAIFQLLLERARSLVGPSACLTFQFLLPA